MRPGWLVRREAGRLGQTPLLDAEAICGGRPGSQTRSEPDLCASAYHPVNSKKIMKKLTTHENWVFNIKFSFFI